MSSTLRSWRLNLISFSIQASLSIRTRSGKLLPSPLGLHSDADYLPLKACFPTRSSFCYLLPDYQEGAASLRAMSLTVSKIESYRRIGLGLGYLVPKSSGHVQNNNSSETIRYPGLLILVFQVPSLTVIFDHMQAI